MSLSDSEIIQKAIDLQAEMTFSSSKEERNAKLTEAHKREVANGDKVSANLILAMGVCYKFGMADGTKTEFNMTDASVNIAGQTTIANSALGAGSSFKARDVTSYNNFISSSNAIPTELQNALMAGRAGLEAWDGSPSIKPDVLEQYNKLSDEITKPTPDKTRLQYLWNGLRTLAGEVKPFVELGILLLKQYGLS